MRKERAIVTETIDWQGITLSVTFEPDYLGFNRTSECALSHLQVESITPARSPLPITETGYRSHFVHPSAIDELGGPVAYVLAWLDQAARNEGWRAHQNAAAQLSLW
ncbi:hypothetical protein [Asticcacaulis sp. EMRT-3]|uniref:hypothetical protein n=1 Tax=Asticcacaulis sp. EMRT-3 TaxID=3040349 RepID=UPI0024AEECAD|nr:hypothetical protein [Asticcacaulis sp. EMRT-3]MDI7774673.1 hypothetical protein [Asticcacaulis sp. EMRT-3]